MKPLIRSAIAKLGLRPPVFNIPPTGFVLRNVTVANPGLDHKTNQTLVVEDSKITKISDSTPGESEGESSNPYAEAFVLPGLIDMHFHYPVLPSTHVPATFDISEWAGPLFLAYGVTTVRDVGSFKSIWKLRQRMENHEFPSPRLFCCGPLLDGDPPRMEEFSWVVHNPKEAHEAVETLADRGVDFIKVYDNLTPESLAAIRETASKRGLAVVGHLPFKVKFEEAGINDLQHVWGIQLPTLQPGLDFNKPEDFAKFTTAWAYIDEAQIEDIVRISVEQNIAHTPTIVTQDRIAHMNDPGADDDPTKFLSPRFFRDILWSPEFGVKYLRDHPEQVYVDFKKGIVKIKQLVGQLHKAGVRVFAGSDGPYNPFTTPGVSLHEELHHLVDSGFTPEEAWVAGTRSAGEFLGMPLLGSLQKDAPADILVFREDPTRDLSALSTLEAVAANGRFYTKETLDQAMADHQKYFGSWLYDRATVSLMRSTLKKLEA